MFEGQCLKDSFKDNGTAFFLAVLDHVTKTTNYDLQDLNSIEKIAQQG